VESIGDNNMQEQFTERCHPSWCFRIAAFG
jgi:hypothetical protein